MATTSSVSEDAATYGREEVEPESEYAVFMRYPILYETAAQDSDSNGIGPLSDTLSCNVVRTRNQFPTLQLTYKRDGIYAKELENGRIIMTDLGPDLVHQKFRINQVQKTVDNIIVNATHIAGDIAYNVITDDIQLPNASATDTFNTLINKLADPMPDIRFDSDIATTSNVNMPKTNANAGNLLIDPDQEGDEQVQSLASLFKGEWTFDNYHFYLQNRGGDDTGLVIKYGRDLKTIEQDDNIANTYNAIYPYATYPPAPPKATDQNEDWNAIGSADGWTSRGTVTYAAGGIVDIYSSPVKGHRIVGQLTNGTLILLNNKISDGKELKDHHVVNTMNGDDWYYVMNTNGVNGWIDAKWITFDKSHDYAISNAVGHYTVDIGTGSGQQTKYPFRGRGVVHYSGSYIRAFYSPFFGSDKPGSSANGHVPVGLHDDPQYARIPTGTYVSFDYKAINEKKDVWYRIAGQPHRWLYGPHISFTAKGTYIEDQTANGRAAVKDGAQKYVMKHGNIVPAPKEKKYVSTRTSRTHEYVSKKYYTKYHGKKISQKHTVKNKAYTKKKKTYVKTTIKKGVYKIHGQVQSGGTTYYKTGNGVYVKSGDVDWKNRMSYKPKSVESAVEKNWENGKIEMYDLPSFGSAINWSIPNGVSMDTGATAHGDGEDWTYVTYEGKSGWVLSKYLKNKGTNDFDSYNPDDVESSDDTQEAEDTIVDNADLTVKLPELTLYAQSAYGTEVPRVQSVDLSSYFQHDDQDESGLDPVTGKYQVTQKDIDQLRSLAEAYMREHRFGEPNVSLTLTAEQISDYQLDNLGLYDQVTVNFDQLGINETAEVNSTTWDAMAHRYTSITIGDLPITYEHQLLQAAKDNTDRAVAKSSSYTNSRSDQLFSQMHQAVQDEGSDRIQQTHDIMYELGMYQKDSHGNPIKNVDGTIHYDIGASHVYQQIQKIDSDVTQAQQVIDQGGSAELQFWGEDSSGQYTQTFNKVHEIRAVGSDYVFKLNSDGISWQSLYGGTTRALMNKDGTIAAQYLDAGEINALTINSAELNGTLKVGEGTGMQINIGTDKPEGARYAPESGGRVIWLNSYNYSAMLSSGQLAIGESSSNGAQTIIKPNVISVGPEWNHVLTMENFSSHAYSTIKQWVQDWVADYITGTGKDHPIWKGVDTHEGVSLPQRHIQ